MSDNLNLNLNLSLIDNDLRLGKFLGKNKILVKINNEAKKEILQSFYHYGDYRFGCSLCAKGDAYSFKNNIKKLSNDKNEFFLNELKIIGNFNFEFKQLVKIYDKQLIKQLYKDYYKKYFTNRLLHDTIIIEKNITNKSVSIHKKKNNVNCIHHSCGISSIFDEVKDSDDEKNMYYFDEYIKIDDINSINLCSICLSWVNILENKINNVKNNEFNNKIKQMNLMECYWKDYVKDYILQNPNIFLINDENKKMLYNWCNDLDVEKQNNNYENLSNSNYESGSDSGSGSGSGSDSDSD